MFQSVVAVVTLVSRCLQDGSTALMCACEHGYMNVVKRLLACADCDAGVEDNVSVHNATPT